MTPLRKRVAERLVQSQRDAALLTTFNEIDMGAVIRLRKEQRDAFRERAQQVRDKYVGMVGESGKMILDKLVAAVEKAEKEVQGETMN